MAPRVRTAAIAAAILALSSLAAGSVVAASQSSDEAALQPTRVAASAGIETKVNDLVNQMTLDEKLQQLQLLSDGQVQNPDGTVNEALARAGLGSVFSLTDPAKINQLQHAAVEHSRLHIPILFAYDTIHGYRTIFPIPLGAASSFDPSVAAADDTVAARETATVGIKQIYSPMVDVSHEPRWGRIAEGGGEDPYLGAVFAAARVKAAQGRSYAATDKVVTSVKHYAAYGQPEGGREYNTTDMSEQRLHNLYLPPFKAAIDAGSDTVMCSFNAINGVPGCANHELETDVLKNQWGFDGFIESDYTAVAELRACPPKNPDSGPCGHGVAADGPGAAQAALNAGTDSEMVSTNIADFGKQLLAQNRISMSRINDAVRRILRVKFRAGLFDHPYVDQAKAMAPGSFLTAADRTAARTAAGRSMVLLKNSGTPAPLPLDPTKSVAVIGPLGDDQHDMLGPWGGKGVDSDAVSVFTGMKAQDLNTTYIPIPGCTVADVDPPGTSPDDVCGSDAGFSAAVAEASNASQIVVAVGESRGQSGEAESRSVIDLPGKQQQLIDAVKATGKPFVVVLFNGRPLTLPKVDASSPAILEAWFPGVEAGNAVADVLFGKVNPGGKLPVSFPQVLGQVPIYYNHEPTGRPCDVTSKWDSRYRDLSTCDPLYEFGFGLSYTKFSVTNLHLSSHNVSKNGKITATVDLTNTGSVKGDDVVQLYIHDPVASISQPVRRLRGFERVTLAPGAMQTVTFTLDKSDFGFYDNRGKFVVEPGTIDVFAGDSSSANLTQSFTVGG
jgi:beta-glucosidase